MKATIFTTVLLAIGGALAAPQPGFMSAYEDDSVTTQKIFKSSSGDSIIDRLRDDHRFSKFVEVLERERGLRDELEKNQATVFAPINEAFTHFKRQGGKEQELRDILKYHMSPDADISGDCLHAGALIPTSLKLRSLGDRHQRIRVFRFANQVFLNMHSVVIGKDIEAKNGRIHAISSILTPPSRMSDMMMIMPTYFSTSMLALERTGVVHHKGNEMTAFIPKNAAWKALGPDNLRYLFSCVGQETSRRDGSWDDKGEHMDWCQGTKDLKKIVEHMVATDDLAYSTDMMKKETMSFKTMAGEELKVCAVRHSQKHDYFGNGNNKQHHNVNEYMFVLNGGAARITCTDLLASNGNIMVTDEVIIPSSVHLPHGKMMAM